MSNPTSRESRRVRFEEVTPTNTIVAFFDAQLTSLAARRSLPIYPGYDDLDDIQFAFLTLPSGQTVTLGQYENSPQIGVDLYVDLKTQDIPRVVFGTCQHLAIPRSQVIWFHPDFEEEIERLYTEHGEIEKPQEPSAAAEVLPSRQYEPIDCFYHALQIYTRQDFPLDWGMLQHNLGLAYFNRIEGDRRENLERSIECFHNSLEIYTQDEFPEKWNINQEDLRQSQETLKLLQKIWMSRRGSYHQILDALPEDEVDRLCCFYVNSTSQIQIARITNINNWYFERVVFPGQRLIFEAPPEAYLEIHTGMMAGAILSDRISCQQLLVLGEDDTLNKLDISLPTFKQETAWTNG